MIEQLLQFASSHLGEKFIADPDIDNGIA